MTALAATTTRGKSAPEEESFEAFFVRNLYRAQVLLGVVVVFFLLRSVGIRAAPVLLIGAAIVLLPICILRPEIGIYALILNFVNEFDTYYGLQQYIPISLPLLFDLVISTGILLQVVLPGRIPRLRYAQNVLLLGYVALVTLAVLLSDTPWPPGYWGRFQTGFLIRPILYLFLIMLTRTPKELHRLLLVFFLAHSMLMATSLSEYLQKGLVGHRVTGTLSATNYLSYLCIATFPILLSITLYLRDRFARVAILGLSLATLFISLQTLSRSGYYALLATLAYLGARLARSPRTVLIVLGFAAVLYGLIPSGLTERLSEVDSLSTTSRFYLSRIGLRMALDHPLLGVGQNAYESEFLKYDYEHWFTKQKSPHSLYFYIAASSGFPALFAYLGIYGITFFQTLGIQRRYRRARDFESLGYFLAIGIQGGLVGHFVFGLAGSYADSYYAFFLLALAIILVRIHQEHPASATLR